MLEAVIMNFGDGARVFYDIDGKPQMFPVGATGEITLDDATARFITQAQSNDTVLLMRKHVDLPANIKAMLDTIRSVRTENYETILSAANKLLGKEAFGVARPSRETISLRLRDAVAAFCAPHLDLSKSMPVERPTNPDNIDLDDLDVAEVLGAKKTKRAAVIRDDVDPDELEEEFKRAPPVKKKPKAAAKKTKSKRAAIRR